MTKLFILTEATCGDACWHAREEVCRCSCGGKNHGVLKTADGVRPVRTARIDGYMYEMVAVGTHRELLDLAQDNNDAFGFASVDAAGQNLYHYTWRETDSGAPYRLKYASKAQIEKWPELSDMKEKGLQDKWFRDGAILWKRTDMPKPARHNVPCEKCDVMYEETDS